LVLFLVTRAVAAEQYKLHSFQKTQLSDQFFCEGASFGDFNRDGAMDIVSGPFWYAGPTFTERFEFYPPKPFDIANYSDNFFAFSYDVDGTAGRTSSSSASLAKTPGGFKTRRASRGTGRAT
jgi:hypothetical protein